jgi:hypothetical protein
MSEGERPSAEEIILYDKDPTTKIATITFNRPEFLNAPTTAGSAVRPDGDDMMLGDAIESGLADSVRHDDVRKFPPVFRLSKSGREKKE